VGLGPYAGVLALTVHSIAALAKLYSEQVENIDFGPIEAVRSTGANWLQIVAYAVLPQVIPPFVAFTLYRWDINVRMSTIIGFVGGGGIGFLIIQWQRLSAWRAIGASFWAIMIVVAILDYASAKARERIV
jgi:phosphonate transport system permease protein